MLLIRDLCVNIITDEASKPVLKGVNLSVGKSEVHVIMGANGSGKTTLINSLVRKDNYEITSGEVLLKGESIADFTPEDCAYRGLFAAFQYPIEIPGVTVINFLHLAYNEQRKRKGLAAVEAGVFLKLLKEKADMLNISMDMLKRPLNVGFSGGEKKRNEILQMLVLDPDCILMDETDSGLDVDATKLVIQNIRHLQSLNKTIIIITHYEKIVKEVNPHYVHIMKDGKIVQTGGVELAEKVDQLGFNF